MTTATDEVLNDVVNGTATNAGNKAEAIRRAFQNLSSDVSPSAVVEHLKKEGIEVTAAYVSVIKGQLMRKVNSQSFEAIRLARKLVRETGSIQGARAALEAVLEEQERTSSLKNLYEGQLTEINSRLDDQDCPLDPKDRRELTMEKKKLQKLLEALEDF